jgi:hypothetical protein
MDHRQGGTPIAEASMARCLERAAHAIANTAMDLLGAARSRRRRASRRGRMGGRSGSRDLPSAAAQQLMRDIIAGQAGFPR